MQLNIFKQKKIDPNDLLNALTDLKKGNFAARLPTYYKGIQNEIAMEFNKIMEMMQEIMIEFSRIGDVVGKEGQIETRIQLSHLSGGWKQQVSAVNALIGDLVYPMTEMSKVIGAVANGDLTKNMPLIVNGRSLEGAFYDTAQTVNTMVIQLDSFAAEVTRVAREVGTEGKLGGQADVKELASGGTWRELTENVNKMASNLTSQVRNIAEVTTAVANGDLTRKITVNVKGEILQLKNTINTMVDQLSSFASEVTRVAKDVGTEGKLGGQAYVTGVAGTWKDLTDNVNQMAFNLTDQVRSIAKVVTAVAQGDLKKKLVVQAKGEIAALSETINNMIDTLDIFADQVTGVAREVGVEGRLGGQASVPGASGTWKNLTDNVNELAANLTNQVRAISKVASAVTMGDLTGTIQVRAQGEVAALKDILNEMISNLKETTLKNSEQDWLKTNIAKITRILQGQRDLGVVARLILSELVPMVSSQHGVFFMSEMADDEKVFRILATYAYSERKHAANFFRVGEGLVGQCAYEKKRILLTNVPSNYIQITSGLGTHQPFNIVVLPILFEGEVKAIIEIGTFNQFTSTQLSLLDQLPEIVGIVLNSIETNNRTETLLKQSQTMARELGTQKEELKKTNEELEEKAEQLATQHTEVAEKKKEVEIAKRALEEKAEQLALASKYKSEFLANMSHELRTPLNSLLLLSQHLANNSLGNLTLKQIEYAESISSSGSDLLNLINDILDLAKIESGVAELTIDEIELKYLINDVERMFSHIAENKFLEFKMTLSDEVPDFIQTDGKKLSQILKNFLSNAYKFTDEGGINLDVFIAKSGWQENHPVLSKALKVVAFKVSDTGLGIPIEKQQIIFEAFQQADGTTNRKYGGCGLGLSISKEIAFLLGGEITLHSKVGKGSIFTFYLPQFYIDPNEKVKQITVAPKEDNLSKEIVPLFPFSSVVDDRLNVSSDDSIILLMSSIITSKQDFLKNMDVGNYKLLLALESNEALKFIEEQHLTGVVIDIRGIQLDANRLIKRIKGELKFRHLPIYIIHGDLEERLYYLKKGIRFFSCGEFTSDIFSTIFADIQGLSNSNTKRILISGKYPNRSILDLFNDKQTELVVIENHQKTCEIAKQQLFDCIILHAENWHEEYEKLIYDIPMHENMITPIVLYADKMVDKKNDMRLNDTANSAIFKVVSSPNDLLTAISKYIHIRYTLDSPKYMILDKIYSCNSILRDKKILIVDDDIRNIFAITSTLEDYEVNILTATSGSEALKILETNNHFDIVLMDIMMPDIDGYEAIRRIRKLQQFKNLIIIAITAKAMKDDCAKCIIAGASDYIPKPIDQKTLLSTLRLWLQ